MSIEKLITEIDLRFISHNSVPVERAPIKAPEWQQIKEALIQAQEKGQWITESESLTAPDS